MEKEVSLFKADIPLYKKVLIFPIWLVAKIYTGILMAAVVLAFLGIIFEIGSYFFE